MLSPWRALARFGEILKENAGMSTHSMVAVGVVGTVLHCTYGVLWLYVAPLDHENAWLRLFGAVSCFGLLMKNHWPRNWKPLLPWYWFGVVLYTLPFFATFQLLGSNYSLLRSMLEVAMIFFVIVIFPQPVLALANLALGMVTAVAAAYILVPTFSSLDHHIVRSVHLQVLIYTVVAGLIFSRTNLKGLLAQGKVDTMKALAGSIAHELRNPLGQLKYRLDAIGEKLPRPGTDKEIQEIRTQELEDLYRELAKGRLAIERGLQVISMTLDEISAKPLSAESVRYISAATATRNAVEEFSYDNPADRARVSLQVESDFFFKGDETRYAFVLFNLLKNASYYFAQHPCARITITVGDHTVSVHDTGPGMKPQVLARLFESFHTAGKPGGTGLGLSFCKRTMLAFGGDIRCESVEGEFTRFVLHFRPVTELEMEEHRRKVVETAVALFGGKRLLVVDDVPGLRASTRSQLQALGAHIDEAANGEQALRMLARENYEAMTLDLSMPLMDGYSTAHAIRAGAVAGKKHLPIVVCTAESPYSARVRLEKADVDAFVQKPCSELEIIEALCRAAEAGRRRTATADLGGRTIMLVDDEPVNRVYLRAVLRERGATVVEAGTGAEVLDRLREIGHVDAVITDINMPGMNGMELSSAIRAMQAPLAGTAIIALTGHSDDKIIAEARAAGMNDLLLKPVEPAELLHRLSRHLGGAGTDLVQAAGRAQQRSAAAPAAGVPLIDSARIERMRTLDLLNELVPEALESAKPLLKKLQSLEADRKFDGMQEVVHSLIGIAGEMGANALRLELRAVYSGFMDSGEWPQDTAWVDRAGELLAQTERAIRDEHLVQAR